MCITKILLNYFIFFIKIVPIKTSVCILDKGILPLEKNSIGIQFFLDIQNDNRLIACRFRSRPKLCCLSDKENTDCDIMKVYGDYYDVLKSKYRDTVLFIYPTLAPHDQLGHCNFLLEYRCGTSKKKREIVKIPFDTRLKKKSQCLLKGYTNGQKITPCDTLDQDSLNQCYPINCDVKYFGNKPFYDNDMNKCVSAVECWTNTKLELPDLVYVPKSNTCKDLSNPLTIADIYAISTGLGITRRLADTEEYKMILKSNCTTISQNLMFLKDLLYGKLYPMKFHIDFTKSCNAAILSILTCIVALSLALLAFVLFAYFTTWFHKKWSTGEFKTDFRKLKKKVKHARCRKHKPCRTYYEEKNKLLKDVITTDLPLELRDSVVDMCDRIDMEERWRKKYRKGDAGNQASFQENSDTSTTTDPDY